MEPMTSRKDRKYSPWLFALGGLAIATTVIVICSWYLGLLTDNFRVVTRRKLYRSGQMSQRELRRTVSTYGIRTIINLQGASSEPWYSGELKTADALGVKHLDIGLCPSRLPPPDKAADLVRAFTQGEYPMLIHCYAGSDRTGLACAIYEMIVTHDPLNEALKEQLTWRCGHFAIGKVRAMDDFFELYRQTAGSKNLARWIVEDYPSHYIERRPAKAGE